MKRFLLFLILFSIGANARAQDNEAMYYTKLAKNATGYGDRVFYNPGVNATVDSVYNYFVAHGTVAGIDVFSAVRVHAADPGFLAWGPYSSQDNYARPLSVLEPYKTGSVLANSTISNSLVNIASGVSTTFDTTGIVGVAVGPDTMITVTVPANAWVDGEPLIVKCIFDGNFGDTMNGAQVLRSQLAVTGATTFTLDSSFGFAGNISQCPYTLEFMRVGSQVWLTPSLYHLAATPGGFGLGGGSHGKNNIGQLAFSYFAYNNSNGSNGAVLSGLDFTQPIKIQWISKWTTGHGGGTHGGNNTQVRMRSAGAYFIPLQ